MNIADLKRSAGILENAVHRHAADSEVAEFARVIAALVEDARAGRITQPLEWRDVPGALFFTEGSLRKYRDIEEAFAVFRILLTGEKPELDWPPTPHQPSAPQPAGLWTRVLALFRPAEGRRHHEL